MTNHTKKWYARVDIWTLAVVVLGGLLHYLLVDYPATQERIASRRLIEKTIEASELNRQLIEADIKERGASTHFLTTSVKQMESETRKASERLRVLKQRIDEGSVIDDLVESLLPNVAVSLNKTTVRGSSVIFDWRLNNVGRKSAIVEAPLLHFSRVHVDSLERASTSIAERSYSISERTRIGQIRPGQTLVGSTTITFSPEIGDAGPIYYYIQFQMKGHLPSDSKSFGILREYYDAETIENKISFYSGQIGSFQLR